jgi:hypothetical protein
MTTTNATLGDCLDSGERIHVYCETWGCHHGKELDLAALAERLGRDHGALHNDLVGLRWRCEKCGGGKVSFRHTPGAMQYGYVTPMETEEDFRQAKN